MEARQGKARRKMAAAEAAALAGATVEQNLVKECAQMRPRLEKRRQCAPMWRKPAMTNRAQTSSDQFLGDVRSQAVARSENATSRQRSAAWARERERGGDD